MKNYLNLLLVLIGVCCCLGDSSGTCWQGDVYVGDVNSEYDGDHIVRPCSLHDMDCIRKFLAHNSYCSVKRGPVPDPLYLDQHTVPLPNANLTVVLNDVQVTGLNKGKITEFYVNKQTDTLLIAVEVRGLTVYSPNMQAKYHRKGREPVVLADSGRISYRKITFTITIPRVNNELKLSRAEVYTFHDDSEPPYSIGPNMIPTAQDPQSLEAYNKWINSVPTIVSEAFVFQGPLFMSVYIQNNLCDFGIKVNSYLLTLIEKQSQLN